MLIDDITLNLTRYGAEFIGTQHFILAHNHIFNSDLNANV